MALYAISQGGLVNAQDVQQLINLLTGQTVDQPVTISGTGINNLTLNYSGAAGVLGLLQAQRGGSAKWFMGLDATDRFAIINAAGNAVNFYIDNSGNGVFTGGVTATTLTGTGAGGSSVAGEFSAPDMKATGVASLGSAASMRYIARWTTIGTPTGLTAQVGDFGVDGNQNPWVCVAAGTPGTWAPVGIHVLFDSTLGADAANFDITSIPASYHTLELYFDGRSTASASADTAMLRINNDSTITDYQSQVLQGSSSTASASQAFQTLGAIEAGLVTGATSTASTSGTVWATIPNYAGTTWQKQVITANETWDTNATNAGRSCIMGGRWLSTAAINRLTLFPSTGPNWKAGSRCIVRAW